jgi:CRP-like cAMP-binding protein
MLPSDAASRPRILIVEDNYLIAQEVGDFVRRCGYAVVGTAPSVESGLALLAGETIEGAVLDIDLAGEPSYPICRALADKGLPFLFLSAYSRPHVLIPPEFRAAPHITKPFEPSQFEAALRGLVGVPPPQAAGDDTAAFGNEVLDTLSPADRAVLAPFLESIPLAAGERLQAAGGQAAFVYFPAEGLISMFAGNTRLTRIEVAAIGPEGMTSPGLLLGDMTAGSELVVQASGKAWRIPAAKLRQLADLHRPLRQHLLDHAGRALHRIMETASYGGRATIVERLARWLVQASHRLGSRHLVLTHDALAEILGVRRPSVSTGLQALEGRRLIRSTRRAIVVLDLEGLEKVADR